MDKTARIAAAVIIGVSTLGIFLKPCLAEKIPGQEQAGVEPGKAIDDAVIDSLELKDMNILDVLKLIAEKSGLNIIAGKGVGGKVTIYLKKVKVREALKIILDSNDLAYTVDNGIVQVMSAREFEEKYGRVFGGEIETQTVRLFYADAGEMEAFLKQIKSSAGKIISDLKSNTLVLMDSSEKLETMKALIRQVDIPVETYVFELSYAQAKEVSENIQDALTTNVGRVKFDERSNKVIVTDTPVKIKEVMEIVKAFDVREEEVLIEAKIIQIVLSDEHKFGINWEALISSYHQLDFTSNFDILSSNDKGGRMNIGTVSGDDYTVLLEALETVGTTNILSSPSITSLNNQEAKILVGATEPYVTTTTTTPSSGPTTTAESVNFIDVGVKLYVTPTIHMDDFITMRIKPEVSSVTKTLTTGNNNTIPVVETSEVETTVMVKDGVTIVIGGLIKEETIKSRNKVPLLGNIPLLGYAFRNNSSLVKKTEIVIFLTPRIISGDVPAEETRVPLSRLP